MPDLRKYWKHAAGALLVLALSSMFLVGGEDRAWVQYEKMVARYETVRKTELSEFEGLLEKVAKERFACYADISAYDKRLVNCRKQYMNDILEIARQNIKSAPSLGEFMLCVRDCPLAYSMCRGVDTDGDYEPSECIEAEVQCVEWCLDTYWRGDGMNEN